MSELLVYSASAGSGKTHSIAGQYILMLFAKPNAWRNILAVTFTNKACDEMKSRIIDELNAIINNLPNNRTAEICHATGLSSQMVVNRARSIFTGMLHDYSFFSVSTIDSFFQKVLRNFTRETGIQYNYELELDTANVINMAVDDLLEKSNSDPQLKKNIISLVEQKMENLSKWDFRSDLKSFLENVIYSDYRSYENAYNEFFSDTDRNKKFRNEIIKIQKDFVEYANNYCNKLSDLMKINNLQIDSFSGGSTSSIIKRLLKTQSQLKSNETIVIDSTFKGIDEAEKWFVKAKIQSGQYNKIVADFISLSIEMKEFYLCEYPKYITAGLIKKNIGYAALISDGIKAIRDYLGKEDKFLISEVPVFLSEIARNNSSSFIYEKTGTFYENYLIDEFQDTSISQWNSFYPLLSESLADGDENEINILVGDVKQSIYAWRGGDWRLLAYKVKESFENYFKTINLDDNWRSGETIVNFNNVFFREASNVLSETIKSNFPEHLAPATSDLIKTVIYGNIEQNVKKQFDSELSVSIFETPKDKHRDLPPKVGIIQKMIEKIEDLQLLGHTAGEMMILVRSNAEGSEIAKSIISHSRSHSAKKGVIYDVISSDALLISANKAVKLLISCFRYLNNIKDQLSFTEAAYIYYVQTVLQDQMDSDLSKEDFTAYFDSKIKHLTEIFRHKLLHELTDIIIEELELNKTQDNIPFLNSFRDLIHDFCLRNPSEIGAFLEYWDESGYKQNLRIPEKQNAINIISIHKSKGLAADFVFVPFCNWELSKSGDMIWVSSPNPPFNALPVWPVNYNQSLESSEFADDYYYTKFKHSIEAFNMMYVAFTRARKGLYISIIDTLDKSNNKISTIVKKVFANQTFLEKINAEAVENPDLRYIEYSIGKIPKAIKENNDDSYMDSYPVYVPQKQIKIKSFFERDKLDPESETSVHKGIVFHKIFEKINLAVDVESAVNKIVASGLIKSEEAENYKTDVKNLINNDFVKDWFSEKYIILNEAEIITAAGQIKRPDRIMISSEMAIIADYKFGSHEKLSYISQTREYAALLKELGFNKIEIYLWFVLSGFVIKVDADSGTTEKITI
jgi:ATP-dependent helicase/nuclease subunit A